MTIGSVGDIDYAIKDAGVAVTIGAVSNYGLLRRETVDALTDSGNLKVIGRRYTLGVREGVFSGLGQDVLVVAGGANYRIENIGVVGPDGVRSLTLVEADA